MHEAVAGPVDRCTQRWAGEGARPWRVLWTGARRAGRADARGRGGTCGSVHAEVGGLMHEAVAGSSALRSFAGGHGDEFREW